MSGMISDLHKRLKISTPLKTILNFVPNLSTSRLK